MTTLIQLPALPGPINELWHVLLALLAAIVAKAAATGLPSPERHYRDLALLLCLVEDPFTLLEQLEPKDRQRLRRARQLLDDAHPAWALAPPGIRARGQISYTILTR